MYEVVAFAKESKDGPFKKLEIRRGDTGPEDVEFDIKFCGICHSDVHVAEEHLGGTRYPVVPGHEMAGVVTKVGAKVKDFKVGDHVGVGCIVDSCATCENCKAGNEEYCCKGFTQTYNSETKYGRIKTELGYTLGGYSSKISVNQNYILRIPKGYPMDKAGPVFCSGITMFSPLQYWGAEKGGKKVGIIGVGGLGQMGIRIAAAMGNEVTAISRSASKKEVAESIGATNYVVSTDPESMKKAAKSLDLILNTVSAKHQAGHYMSLLNYDGTLVQLGLVTEPHMISGVPLAYGRISIAGSLIGGIKATQDCIDFCAEKKIYPQTEIVTATKLGSIYEQLNKGNDSITRYVLDIEKSVKEAK